MELVLSVIKKGNSMTDLVKSVTNKGISMSKEYPSVMEKGNSVTDLVLFFTEKGFSVNKECPFKANKSPSTFKKQGGRAALLRGHHISGGAAAPLYP